MVGTSPSSQPIGRAEAPSPFSPGAPIEPGDKAPGAGTPLLRDLQHRCSWSHGRVHLGRPPTLREAVRESSLPVFLGVAQSRSRILVVSVRRRPSHCLMPRPRRRDDGPPNRPDDPEPTASRFRARALTCSRQSACSLTLVPDCCHDYRSVTGLDASRSGDRFFSSPSPEPTEQQENGAHRGTRALQEITVLHGAGARRSAGGLDPRAADVRLSVDLPLHAGGLRHRRHSRR